MIGEPCPAFPACAWNIERFLWLASWQQEQEQDWRPVCSKMIEFLAAHVAREVGFFYQHFAGVLHGQGDESPRLGDSSSLITELELLRNPRLSIQEMTYVSPFQFSRQFPLDAPSWREDQAVLE